MEITPQELTILNFYRASELYGGLLLGQLARRTRDPQLMLELTRHGAEEVVHAQLWAECILSVGGRPRPIRRTYQTRYAEVIGRPTGMLQVLALTQVFERRVYRHFLAHLRRPGTHAAVRVTLRRMIAEEKGHLSWVRQWLDRQEVTQPGRVKEIMRRYSEADEVVYTSLLDEFGWARRAA